MYTYIHILFHEFLNLLRGKNNYTYKYMIANHDESYEGKVHWMWQTSAPSEPSLVQPNSMLTLVWPHN